VAGTPAEALQQVQSHRLVPGFVAMPGQEGLCQRAWLVIGDGIHLTRRPG